ncbi:MAG: alpha/beta fold hydrolase [Saprospiraceae bacterium]
MKMIKSFLTLSLLSTFFAPSAVAQNDITGDWYGTLDLQGMMKLRIVFHVQKTDDGLATTLDSPDQKAFGIPVGTTTFSQPDLSIEMPALMASFKGAVNEDFTELNGTFEQRGAKMPLVMGRLAIEAPTMPRPQEPKPPFPYYEEEVVFENTRAGVSLAGSLTLPTKEGKYPVVVLVSGSGPQDRNEELLGHKPFLVLADHLTRRGIGVLRYDDRGVGGSTGDHGSATSEDFAGDALAAVAYLKTRPEVDAKNIGIAGHSEGGMIAPMCAARSRDVAFIVLLAGTGGDGEEILLKQIELINRANGYSEERNSRELAFTKTALHLIKTEQDTSLLKPKLTAVLEEAYETLPEDEKAESGSKEDFVKQQADPLMTPWFRFFIKYDPKTSLEKVKCPVLAINGEKDLQVEPKINLAGIKAGLEKGGNTNFTIKELPNLNHLFQTCKTGSPKEYSQIEETFSPVALKEVSDWIMKTVKTE